MRLLIAASTESGPGVGPESLAALARRTTAQDLVELAMHHGVAGLAYERLREAGLEPSVLEAFRARHDGSVRQHLRTVWTLSRIAPVLDIGTWAVVKGPVVVETLYDAKPGRRPYLDLDLLVAPAQFGEVVDTLESLGARLMDRNWKMLRRDLRGELHLVTAEGTAIDLHWHLINMYRGRMAVDTDEVLGRARRVLLGGVEVPTLDPTDGMLHLALHAALSGGDRLMWLKDLERAAVCWNINWQALVERVKRWRIEAPVGLMLSRARDVLGAEVPVGVTEELVSARIARVETLVERLSPWEFGLGRLTAPSRVFARGIGHGLLRGSAWVAWRSLRNLDPWQESRSSSFTPRGHAEDRKAFVRAVARQSSRARNEPA